MVSQDARYDLSAAAALQSTTRSSVSKIHRVPQMLLQHMTSPVQNLLQTFLIASLLCSCHHEACKAIAQLCRMQAW